MDKLLMAIDVGTSGTRVALFTQDGAVAGSRSAEYSCQTDGPGYSQIDAEIWWESALACIEGLKADGLPLERVAAIGVDGISWVGLPVDEAGHALSPALTWMDRRSRSQAESMVKRVGAEALFAVAGNPPDPAYIAPKMLYFKENEPDIYRRAHCFIQCNSYIVLRLTGTFSQDYSQGYGFHFFDVARRQLRGDVAEAMGVDAEKVAPFYESHQVVGGLLGSVARRTGLTADIPVVAGGLDAACCTLGAGVITPGDTQEQGGQAGGMSIDVDHALMHPRLILGCHVVPGQWLLQGGSVGGGGALRWFREQLGAWEDAAGREEGLSAYEVFSREAETVPAGCQGLCFLPYMAGERSPIWDSNARGVFAGLSYDKSRAHMVRAVMEGVAFSLQHNLETAYETGARVDTLRSVGGSANSQVWTQIKSDVTGLPIQVPFSDQATTLGAALLAGVGAGIYRDFAEAVRHTVRIQRVHEPDPAMHRRYMDFYRQYRELYQSLVPWFGRMSELEKESCK